MVGRQARQNQIRKLFCSALIWQYRGPDFQNITTKLYLQINWIACTGFCQGAVVKTRQAHKHTILRGVFDSPKTLLLMVDTQIKIRVNTLRGLVSLRVLDISTHLETYSAYDCGVKRPFAHQTTDPLIARPLSVKS